MADTLIDVLQRQAATAPDRAAFSFYSGDEELVQVTFAQLDAQARAIAAQLQGCFPVGERVLLVFPAGLDFVAAFFGCLYAGLLAVPATYPKPRRPMPRLESIARDSGARVALTNSATLELIEAARLAPQLAPLRWIAIDQPHEPVADWQRPAVGRDDLAFLQYTSGSTTEPRGVMVSHGNLLHNLEMIRQGFGISAAATEQGGVFWLPAYHDMGLIGGILEPLYVGGHSILMAPQTFLQRPVRWLQLISQSQAAVSGAPNFAYDLCVQKTTAEERAQLDLSSWQVAFCGAEPIRPETLESFAELFGACGFRRSSFYPCFGLAEGTLLAAGGEGPGAPHIRAFSRAALAEQKVQPPAGEEAEQRLVGCGHALLGQELAIVDPETCTPCEPDRVGEIWVRGPSIARGYWNRPEETAHTFGGQLAGSGESGFLRTGDLGFVSEGQLFVTGRIKDVIIIRGRNYYPQDLEDVVSKAHPALRLGAGCAFAAPVKGQERLVIVQELDRQFRETDLAQLVRDIRRAVAEEHELEVGAVVVVRHASLPRTTSGKIQRALCRDRYLADDLKVLYHCTGKAAAGETGGTPLAPSVPRPDLADLLADEDPLDARQTEQLAERVEGWLLAWLSERSGTPLAEIAADRPFFEYGLDSLAAVELSQELEDWLAVRLTPVVAWNHPTPTALGRYLAEQVAAARRGEPLGDEAEMPAGDEFEDLLAEIETLSEEEAEAALRRQREQP